MSSFYIWIFGAVDLWNVLILVVKCVISVKWPHSASIRSPQYWVIIVDSAVLTGLPVQCVWLWDHRAYAVQCSFAQLERNPHQQSLTVTAWTFSVTGELVGVAHQLSNHHLFIIENGFYEFLSESIALQGKWSFLQSDTFLFMGERRKKTKPMCWGFFF